MNSKIQSLEKENEYNKKELNSKRYKIINKVENTLYKIKNPVRQQNNTTIIEPKPDYLVQKEAIKNRKITPKKVAIINHYFYDWDGKRRYKGGAERYVYDLSVLLKSMGFKVHILQCSNKPFKKVFNGVQVIGIGKGVRGNFRECSKAFNDYCSDYQFLIASPIELAQCINKIPIIGISHGINFDSIINKYNPNTTLLNYRGYIEGLKNVENCVCVDTNFINWTRTIDYQLSLKEIFIPNYYEPASFKKVINKKITQDKITFLYPRRICEARGYDLVIEAFDEIFKEYGNSTFLRLVGQIEDDQVRTRVDDFLKKYPDNVSIEEYEMNEMDKAYNNADVILIPTRYSEGTSLSCIEAMGCGKAIIATNIGGLTNLIINNYNGLIINPTAEDLCEAIKKIINNPGLIELYSANAKNIAERTLQKNSWTKEWKKIIKAIDKIY